jgi:hypothetical protein
MPKTWFVNALVNPRGSVHVAARGGDVSFGSFCLRQSYGAPPWSTWVWFGVAFAGLAIPSTPGQSPYRLSKLWFSS